MKIEYLKLPFAQHATAQFKHSLIRNPPLSLGIFRRFGSIAALVKIYHRMRFGTAPEVYRRITHSRIAELNRLYRRLHIVVTRPKTAKRVVKRIIGVNIAGNACCDAPQTQAGLTLDGRIPLSAALGSKAGALYFNAGWQLNARMYADFEPSSRTDEDAPDAYRLPSYSLVDATVGWEGSVSKGLRLNLFACCRNLFDAHYIERGIDGTTHDLESFRGYWGAPRQFSFGMRLAF